MISDGVRWKLYGGVSDKSYIYQTGSLHGSQTRLVPDADKAEILLSSFTLITSQRLMLSALNRL